MRHIAKWLLLVTAALSIATACGSTDGSGGGGGSHCQQKVDGMVDQDIVPSDDRDYYETLCDDME